MNNSETTGVYIDEYLSQVNGRLLANQRLTLIRLADDRRISKEKREHIEGVINFLDGIADYITDELGIDCLIHSDDEEDE